MNFADDFSKTFCDKEEFLEFLDGIECGAEWQKHPTNTVLVIAGEEEPEICEKIKDMDEKEEIIKDTMKNSGLFLCLGSTYYPVGQTTMKSIESRARIAGSALLDLPKGKLARVLNDCLKVTKGNALVRIHEGKVRAVHGGDPSDYSVLTMPELFEVASIYVAENYDKATFSNGLFSHSLAMASWELEEKGLLDTYRELLLQYGLQADNVLSALIRVQTSDVGVSGANIYYSLLLGAEKKPLILGKPLKLEHTNNASIEDFSQNMGQIFARYQEAIGDLSKLFHVYASYPANVMASVMIKAGISKALTAQTVEQFKAGHGPGICNGYDIYCGICEAIFLAQSNGMGAKALTDLEEMVSRCLTYRFHEYDIPGTILY